MSPVLSNGAYVPDSVAYVPLADAVTVENGVSRPAVTGEPADDANHFDTAITQTVSALNSLLSAATSIGGVRVQSTITGKWEGWTAYVSPTDPMQSSDPPVGDYVWINTTSLAAGSSVDTSTFVKAADLTAATDLVTLSALTAALTAKADLSALTTLANRVTALENGTAISGGNGGGTPGAGSTPTTTGTRPATPTTSVQPTGWLRSDAITGVAGGGTVTTWTSSTGSGDATVNTQNAGTAPTLVANAIGTRPAVRFLKSAVSKMKFGSASWAVASDHTILVVARHPTIANAGFLVHGFNDTTGVDAADRMAIRSQVTTGGAFLAGAFGGTTGGTSSATTAGTVVANTWNVFSIDFTTAFAPTVTLNGTSATTGNGATDAPGTLTKLALGGYGTGSGDVDYAEVIYFASKLSTTDRKLWEKYLATTYSLTVAS